LHNQDSTVLTHSLLSIQKQTIIKFWGLKWYAECGGFGAGSIKMDPVNGKL
jgi:hypothetical protein